MRRSVHKDLSTKWLTAAVFGSLALLYLALPLGTAVEMGGDEGFELEKGFLCSRGFVLYKNIWSDQPPLFTLFLSSCFRLFGDSLLTARVLAASFGVLLFVMFYLLVQRRSDLWRATLATFFLVASPAILFLSGSVMQEVPAFATGLLSVLLISKLPNKRRWMWIFASGIIMGVALQIKLTAALIIPATFLEIALNSILYTNWKKRASLDIIQWIGGLCLSFVLISFLFGAGSLQMSWRAHTGGMAAQTLETGVGRAEDFPLKASTFVDHIECVSAAVLVIGIAILKRRLRQIAFPLVLLITALSVHLVHRPWWMYYYLHIAIPLSWLAGLAIGDVIQACSNCFSAGQFRTDSPSTWKGLVLAVIAGLVLVRSELRLESAIKDIRLRPPADTNPFVLKMREYSTRTHWAYAQREILAFHAGLLLPPELAVVTLKRLWSGQITRREVVEICKRYQTEQVLLNTASVGNEWTDFLKDFEIVCRDQHFVLYVAKRIR